MMDGDPSYVGYFSEADRLRAIGLIESIEDQERSSKTWKNIPEIAVESIHLVLKQTSSFQEAINQLTQRMGKFTSHMNKFEKTLSKMTDRIFQMENNVQALQRHQLSFAGSLTQSIEKLKSDVENSDALMRQREAVLEGAKLKQLIEDVQEAFEEQTLLSNHFQKELKDLWRLKCSYADLDEKVADIRKDVMVAMSAPPPGAGPYMLTHSAERTSGRWLWTKSTLIERRDHAVSWDAMMSKTGNGLGWDPGSPAKVIVRESGIYRVAFGCFAKTNSTSVPSLTLHVSGDEVVSSVHCSSYLYNTKWNGKLTERKSSQRPCRGIGPVSGSTVLDYIFFPANSCLVFSCRGDIDCEAHGFLEIQAFC